MRRACILLPVCVLFPLYLLSSCRGRPSPHANSALDAIVRDYIGLAAALGERDPDSLDYYHGPADWVSDIRAHPPSFREIKSSAVSLVDRLHSLSAQTQSSPRIEFLIRQLHAIVARVDVLTGRRKSFDEESQALFGVSAPRSVDDRRFAAVRAELDRLLPGTGSLAVRYATFDKMFLIPRDRLSNVVDRAMTGCRSVTAHHLVLPAGEGVSVEYVADKPWDGYSYYRGRFRSVIQINADFALTVGRALDLACHEGYPGHHVYNSLQDSELVQRAGRLELLVQPVFSPQSFLSESLATIAPLIAFSESQRLAFERDELFPILNIDKSMAAKYARVERLVAELEGAEMPIAREYLDGQLEFARAASALEDQALMLHSESTLKYLNEYRTYMLTYTLGSSFWKDCLNRQGVSQDSEEARWNRYREWILADPGLKVCEQ
jgi:hypothetical protein